MTVGSDSELRIMWCVVGLRAVVSLNGTSERAPTHPIFHS